ncbi:MAG: hypothetical protein H7145_06450 [Akkermansiaceae bacterium]|nr:hypothetical protein [Armatimonadota bacterium]
MRILFGPEHDGLHIDPNEPNGYEWWYFDAISDDERYVLVVIFFLGTPMSPYYKAVVDGKNPLPKDWCGVFVSLHERTKDGYKERAYTYNLYRNADLFTDGDDVRIGRSHFCHAGEGKGGDKYLWMLSLNERGLWRGSLTADLTFYATFAPRHDPIDGSNSHSWVCTAPMGRLNGKIQLPSNEVVEFSGYGYHDHNFGKLPWSDTKIWFWSRTHFGSDESVCGMVNYSWLSDSGRKTYFIFWKRDGTLQIVDDATIAEDANGSYLTTKRGMLQQRVTGVEQTGIESLRMSHPAGWSLLQSSPFYCRFPLVTETQYPARAENSFIGIGEIFQPERLCGPIISRMMWTRIRRRS